MISLPFARSLLALLVLSLASCEVVESDRTAPSSASVRAAGGAAPRVSSTGGGGASAVLSAEKMSPRLQYRGFSLTKPAEKEWYLVMKEQSPQRAILHRKVKSPTRSVYFAAGLNLIDRAPQSPEDFARLVKPNLTDGSLQKPVYTPKATTVGGQPAIAYELSATLPAGRDGKVRVLRDRGLIVLHPSHPVTVVQVVFSQRGTEGELDETLEAEGRALLEGVQAGSLE